MEPAMDAHNVFHMREMPITGIGGIWYLAISVTSEEIIKPMHH